MVLQSIYAWYILILQCFLLDHLLSSWKEDRFTVLGAGDAAGSRMHLWSRVIDLCGQSKGLMWYIHGHLCWIKWMRDLLVEWINKNFYLQMCKCFPKHQYFGYWCKEPTHWKRPLCWERFSTGRVGGNRGWNGWRTSPTQWTWLWANFRRWWRTGKPGMLQSMGSQRVRRDLVTEQQTVLSYSFLSVIIY